jgi:hypothetical protein
MLTVTFVVAAVLFLTAAAFFSWGLVQLGRGNQRALNTLTTGFGIGLVGVVVAAIIFGFFG